MTEIETLSGYTMLVFSIIFFGYIAQTSLLQLVFYSRSSVSDANSWKIQPRNQGALGRFWFFPPLSQKPARGPYHRLFAIVNLSIASVCAAVTTECSLRRLNYMSYEGVISYGWESIGWDLLKAVIFQSVAEYYWHRMMHLKFFYVRFHKIHHYYKSPEPWDDMYIHPLEAFGYYCILYAPPFIMPMHYVAFIGYMIVMGICGVMDHSGIRFKVPGLYNTEDHDNHHLKFEVNYSFPFPHMDILHGTFDGEYCGVKFSCLRKKHTL